MTNFISRLLNKTNGDASNAEPKARGKPDRVSQDTRDQSETRDATRARQDATTVSDKMSAQARAEDLVRREKEEKSRRDRQAFEGLPAGITLGRKMGDGAFSHVFEAVYTLTPAQLAIDPTSAKTMKVAVKCVRKYEDVPSQGLQGPKRPNAPKKKPKVTDRANIEKEVAIMRTLNHPNIIRLMGFSDSPNHYFITLELMEGGELFHQIVKLTYFSEALSRHVILQVANGIRYLHEERGVVHRDIKPENILFESIPIIPSKTIINRPYDSDKEDEGEFTPGVGGGGISKVKIADFGLSKILWDDVTMTPCGTVGYTAPEIVKDQRYSKSVDMWALGCVLYTLLCGFPPFYDESIHVLTEKVARGYYTFLSPWWDDISPSSKDLVAHLLEVDPVKRYTIDEFLAHPWMKEKAPAQRAHLDQVAPAVKFATSESPLLAPGGRRALQSPGVANLKEAFDVTYAVHRMGEEQNLRKPMGKGGFLQGLEEDDEDEGELEDTKRKYGAEVSKMIEDQRRQMDKDGGTQQTAEEAARAAANYAGWGGANRRMAEAALYDGRAGPRDRGNASNRRGFELKLNKATLLSRRKNVSHPMLPTSGTPMQVEV